MKDSLFLHPARVFTVQSFCNRRIKAHGFAEVVEGTLLILQTVAKISSAEVNFCGKLLCTFVLREELEEGIIYVDGQIPLFVFLKIQALFESLGQELIIFHSWI